MKFSFEMRIRNEIGFWNYKIYKEFLKLDGVYVHSNGNGI